MSVDGGSEVMQRSESVGEERGAGIRRTNKQQTNNKQTNKHE